MDAALSLPAQDHSTVTLLARFRGLSTSRAEFDCEVIGEKLKRDDGQDGHYVLGRFRQHDDFIGDLFEVLGDRFRWSRQ
jgi:hypothetical protein